MTDREDESISEPLDNFDLEDEDDLSTLALALDEVATRLAAHSLLRGVVDVEDEPLDSLIERAANAVGAAKVDAKRWTGLAASLAQIAHVSRYAGGPATEELEEAQAQKEDLAAALRELEKAMAR
jgi:hypothetical protein